MTCRTSRKCTAFTSDARHRLRKQNERRNLQIPTSKLQKTSKYQIPILTSAKRTRGHSDRKQQCSAVVEGCPEETSISPDHIQRPKANCMIVRADDCVSIQER